MGRTKDALGTYRVRIGEAYGTHWGGIWDALWAHLGTQWGRIENVFETEKNLSNRAGESVSLAHPSARAVPVFMTVLSPNPP